MANRKLETSITAILPRKAILLEALRQFGLPVMREGTFLDAGRKGRKRRKHCLGVAGLGRVRLRTRAMAELVRALSSAHFLLFFGETFDDGMPYLSSSERGAE